MKKNAIKTGARAETANIQRAVQNFERIISEFQRMQ